MGRGGVRHCQRALRELRQLRRDGSVEGRSGSDGGGGDGSRKRNWAEGLDVLLLLHFERKVS
eukprot:5698066-Prymnesium_polylepis.1